MHGNKFYIMLKRFLFLSLLVSFGGRAVAQSQEQEAKLKAVFIYNFTKYIDWDTTGAENDFVIGVIGSSGVTEPLMEIAKTNPVKNKRIIIRVFNKPEEIVDCQILFIPQKLPFPLHSILDRVGRGVLTVSEETGYANLGTAFNFIIKNDKLKFEANLKAIYSAGLRAGSQLLKLAIIVDD
jgi:YfiR/HmsC-like